MHTTISAIDGVPADTAATRLIRPTKHELAEFGKPDFVIYNAGGFSANSLASGMGSKISVDLRLKTRSW